MTKIQFLWSYAGTSDDFEQDSNDYFAFRAIELNGCALRDNSYSELVAIGKRAEELDSD